MNSSLLALLACPQCHGPLVHDADTLACGTCNLAFPVEDGLPILLIEKAIPYQAPPSDSLS